MNTNASGEVPRTGTHPAIIVAALAVVVFAAAGAGDGLVEDGQDKAHAPEFAADRLAGSGGCNALTAIYEVGEAAIAVRALDVGERSCEAELMRQEARFVDVLAGAARYERADGRLIIADAQGRRMVFAAGV